MKNSRKTVLTVKVSHTQIRDYQTETEVLADIEDQCMSPFVMAATLRALAEELSPSREKAPF